ncbi:DUF92 domain-containing protein [Alkalicoccus halolimnae]|uniref:DUF92 domain-containing protein n=1 Tax=Alkalicoccus halolimnae TaxID=1667239 RepID=A0AAJ8LU36_9BACI|nr:DUF92 domain-containing protein [Alkalicoccus halolimnae]
MTLFLTLLVFLIAAGAWLKKSLTTGGAAAAVFAGLSSIFGFGFSGLAVMGTFFFTSVFLEKILHSTDKIEEKGSRRDAWQVLANGGAASLWALGNIFFPLPVLFVGFTAAYAAAAADTWASTVGKRSRKKPVLIRSRTEVENGISGGVTALGNTAAVLGSLAVVSAAYIFNQGFIHPLLLLTVVVIGFAGQISDAWMGAVYQRLFQCRICGKKTEKMIHCETSTTLVKGKMFMTNDLVNFLTVTGSSAAAVILYLLFTGNS